MTKSLMLDPSFIMLFDVSFLQTDGRFKSLKISFSLPWVLFFQWDVFFHMLSNLLDCLFAAKGICYFFVGSTIASRPSNRHVRWVVPSVGSLPSMSDSPSRSILTSYITETSQTVSLIVECFTIDATSTLLTSSNNSTDGESFSKQKSSIILKI